MQIKSKNITPKQEIKTESDNSINLLNNEQEETTNAVITKMASEDTKNLLKYFLIFFIL